MTLHLTEGRYYLTRNGRKVGPMRRWDWHDASRTYGFDGLLNGGPNYSFFPDGRHGSPVMRNQPECDIVAEWSDTPASPVRQITTTRTEITPGTYGLVCVGEPSDGKFTVVMPFHRPDAEELRAAATILNDLASALDAIAAERNAP
jgi:hypothetical protein